MSLNTKYASLDEFKQYTGIDLTLRLKSDDNPSATAESFLARVTSRLETFIDANFYRNVEQEFPSFTDYQKKHFKLAIIEQCLYVFKNGDISTDSGYDPEEGEKTKLTVITEKSIAPNARQELLLCGLWCRKIKNGGRNSADISWLY